MAITTMVMITTMDTATAILTVMGIPIHTGMAAMIITTTMGTIMTTTTIMRTMTMCITKPAPRITAKALPASMYPA